MLFSQKESSQLQISEKYMKLLVQYSDVSTFRRLSSQSSFDCLDIENKARAQKYSLNTALCCSTYRLLLYLTSRLAGSFPHDVCWSACRCVFFANSPHLRDETLVQCDKTMWYQLLYSFLGLSLSEMSHRRKIVAFDAWLHFWYLWFGSHQPSFVALSVKMLRSSALLRTVAHVSIINLLILFMLWW